MAEGEGFDRPPAGSELRCAKHSLARKIPLRHATGISRLDALGFESYFHSKLKQPAPADYLSLAEGEGFEPSMQLPANRLSKAAP